MIDVARSSAVELARALRGRQVSAVELVDAVLDRIAAVNARLNAVVTLDAERARDAARNADLALGRGERLGPLHGVPFTAKDCFETRGLRTTAGYGPLAHHVPGRDALAVARLRAAGALLVGKTNPATLAGNWQTDNPVFGRTSNPWDPGRTPGGSGGGGAAAVAAGLTPLDLGSDLGGSMRIPAHFCGVCALKPTDRRVPGTGHIPDDGLPGPGRVRGAVRHMACYGPIARSVRDLRPALEALADPPACRGGADRAGPAAPGGSRLLVTARPAGLPISKDTQTVIGRLVERLSHQGAHCTASVPEVLDLAAAWSAWGLIAGTEAAGAGLPLAADRDRLRELLARPRSTLSSAYLSGLLREPGPYDAAHRQRAALTRAIDELLDDHDAWLLPVSPGPAFPHSETGAPIDVDGAPVDYFEAVAGLTTPLSLSGHPVVALPAGWSGSGLPIGVQLVGRRGQDERLLDVAEQVAAVAGAPSLPPGL